MHIIAILSRSFDPELLMVLAQPHSDLHAVCTQGHEARGTNKGPLLVNQSLLPDPNRWSAKHTCTVWAPSRRNSAASRPVSTPPMPLRLRSGPNSDRIIWLMLITCGGCSGEG